RGRAVRSLAAGQRDGRSAVDAYSIDLAFVDLALPILVEVGAEQHRPAVRSPGDLSAAGVERAEGQLGRSAAIGRKPEDLGIARLEITGSVEAVGDCADEFERVRPFGAFRLWRRGT